MTARQCSYMIITEWPKHRAVLSRRRCKNRTSHPSGRCHQHPAIGRNCGAEGWPCVFTLGSSRCSICGAER